jgi:hypothetical protein
MYPVQIRRPGNPFCGTQYPGSRAPEHVRKIAQVFTVKIKEINWYRFDTQPGQLSSERKVAPVIIQIVRPAGYNPDRFGFRTVSYYRFTPAYQALTKGYVLFPCPMQNPGEIVPALPCFPAY